ERESETLLIPAPLAFYHRHGRHGPRRGNQQRLALALQDERPLGPHHHFAVVTETVAIDRRITDDDLLVAQLRIIGLVAGGWVFVGAVDVVFRLAIEGEQRPHA